MRKKTLSRSKLILVSVFLLGRAAFAGGHAPPQSQLQPQKPPQQQSSGTRHVDLVIALDTSSSMDGLIDSARQKLWDVVNLLGKAKPAPILRVGLISYGNTGYDAKAGWVRKDSDLTTDLDGLYAKLFALRTGGGDEYVARAVSDATRTMQWDQNSDTLKIIFVAGNEPANQDPKIAVESAVQAAREKGIFVNAIYCGSQSAGEAVGWANVAKLGAGKFAAIDQNRIVRVSTPMDEELAKLSVELNQTYVAYGRAGDEKKANQAQQDANASSLGREAAASRAAAKSKSSVYRNDDWDLLDARAHGKKDLANMKTEELPAAMQSMAPAAREAYLDGKAKERAALQKRISEVSVRREQFLAEKRKRSAAPADSLDEAVNGAIMDQGKAAGFGF
jgi:hypothetical protein